MERTTHMNDRKDKPRSAGDASVRLQGSDLLLSESETRKHCSGSLWHCRRRDLQANRRANQRSAVRRYRTAVLHMHRLRGFAGGQHGRDADVLTVEQLYPLVAGLGSEDARKALEEGLPLRAVDELATRQVGPLEHVAQPRVELRLDGGDREVASIGGLE